MPTLLPARQWLQKSAVIICAALAVGASACQEDTAAPAARRTQQAYDLAGFLDQEAKALSAQQAAARKTVSEGGVIKEAKTVSTLNWAEELGPFADADINKPALTGLFTKTTSFNAQGQQVHRYQAKEDVASNVKEVTYTLDAQGQLVRLDATIVQENMLFQTQKLLHLEAPSGPSPRLLRYSLDETQKLLLMEPDRYRVTGEVIR
ncbi:hypothetical protein [Rufibacter psychrotolerans]|uniref:hypothetical protein n=1 Tax=Rufibacter psychrotolerans TaxID=2812556 RepID=UPI00196707C1|nr:hypothetical protein [Rufibacter sp. SYSU D00308]